MKTSTLFSAFFLLALGLSTAYGGDLLDGGQELKSESAHRNVNGTIEKIESNSVFIKTDEGTSRNFAVNEVKREGLKSLKAGDKVTVELDEGNQIVDIHRDGELAQKDESASTDMGGPAKNGNHRSITGTIEMFDQAKKSITIKSDNGKTESFELKDAAFTKLNSVKKGEKVTLEIDEQNRVMDAHKG
jgi:cold shock CspA family protein